ncbi:MAG: LptF/LptG family permease [Spirochaetales bacterium]|nr:LptF/LptG family permease [Spirochaetales bacterium]
MKHVHRMIIKTCALVFLLTLVFFVVLLELIDLFAYLWSYIDKQVSIGDILFIVLLYVPKCVSYAVPVAMLFAISYTLGMLYANNELIAVLGGGMSFFRLILPLIFIGFFMSVSVFVFEEKVVLPAFKSKNERQAVVLQRPEAKAGPSADIGFIDRENDVLLKVDAYTPQDISLSGVFIFDRGRSRVVYSDRAVWDGAAWIMPNAWVYEYDDGHAFLVGKRVSQYRASEIRQDPEKFKLTTHKIDEMDLAAASEWIAELKESGLPAEAAETGYFNKFSYALRVFIVAILAASVGRVFRKNILLMYLLLSLSVSVVFFVFQLITDALAKNAIVSPWLGAFLPIMIFLAIASIMLSRAQT